MGETPDMSSIFELLSSVKNTQNATDSSENNSSAGNCEKTDMETKIKIMKIMNSINSNENTASTNLLNSLKPFLRDTKKEKIDQYIRLLKISNIISQLNLGGDEK